MKRILTLVAMIVMATGIYGFAEDIYIEGEGYATPTPKSQEPFNPELSLKRNVRSQATITFEPNADGYPTVVLQRVQVFDQKGDLIRGLTKGDFSVYEKSNIETTERQQTITVEGKSTEMSVAVIIDASGSMATIDGGAPLEKAKNNAVYFLNQCQNNDNVSVIVFSDNHNLYVLQPLIKLTSETRTTIINDIRTKIMAGNKTALFDAVGKGVESLKAAPSSLPKNIIVFTDGNSNDDLNYTINEAINAANTDKVAIYTVGIGNLEPVDIKDLEDLAGQTGGQYILNPADNDIASLYNKMNPGGQYTITYTTNNPNFDGSIRTVTATYNKDTTINGTGTYQVDIELKGGEFRMISFLDDLKEGDSTCTKAFSGLLAGTYDNTKMIIANYVPGYTKCEQSGYQECQCNHAGQSSELNITPGKAYWFYSTDTVRFKVNNPTGAISRENTINLNEGWNMIGCPNNANYNWNDVMVRTPSGDQRIGDLSEENEYIDKALWRLKNGARQDDPCAYEYEKTDRMIVYEGYWVKARHAVTLVFPESHTLILTDTMQNIKNWIAKEMPAPREAVAADSPPSPPCGGGAAVSTAVGSSDSGSSSVGCFITNVIE